MKKIIIGSRGSDLALWQANHIKNQLEKLGCEVTITIIKTQGDAIQHLSFDKMEGKGFFTKELESALLDKTIDLAVHSHKDLETTFPKGLTIAAVSEREDPRDVLLIRKDAVETNKKWNLKSNAIVGTSSARRKSQIITHRPDIQINDLRGNVPTRIQKLIDGNYDAILLAKAGLDRLNINTDSFFVEVLDPSEFVPAPAQGVLGLQIREDDEELTTILAQLNHTGVQSRISVERKVLNLMQGGCQLPLGVYCNEDMRITVSFAKDWTTGSKNYEYDGKNQPLIAEKIVADLREL